MTDKHELKSFEAMDDRLTLMVHMHKSEDYPIFTVSLNNKNISGSFSKYDDAKRVYRIVREALLVKYEGDFCQWCGEAKVGVKNYQLGSLEEGYAEKLCFECKAKAEKQYSSVTEIES